MSFDTQNNTFPPSEQSLKYMAWNVKQIDEHLKSIAVTMKETSQAIDSLNNTLKAIGKVLQSKA